MKAFCRLVLFLSIFLIAGYHPAAAQIFNADGVTPVTTRYCCDSIDFEIVGKPNNNNAGKFSGCGVFQRNGKWYFNPVVATIGVTVFPVSCELTYKAAPDGTTFKKSILIEKPVVINPPLKDSFTCNGHFTLAATTLYAGAYVYSWDPYEPLDRPDTSITAGYITNTTTFVLTAVDQVGLKCVGRDTVTIEVYPVPDLIVSNDTLIKSRQQVQLHASGAKVYEWFPSRWLDNNTKPDPWATPQAPTTYTVVGTNEYGCKDTAQVFIDINEELFVPNAFTPNGDGINDIFRIENFGYQGLSEFRVFNRLGQEVFHTLDGTKGWDGTHNGNPAEAAVYFYMIRLAPRDGTVKIYKGDVTLVR